MKDYRGEILSIINEFAGQANVISVPRTFVKLLDSDISTAIFLSQCLYWQDRVVRKDGYFYKTMDEWENEIGLNEYYIRKATKKLKELKIIDTKLKKAEGRPTVHYKILKGNFNEWLLRSLTLKIDENENEDDVEKTGEPKKDVPNPYVFYEENGFGLLSPYIRDEIGDVIDNYGFDEPEELIIGALKIGVQNNARKWKYVQSILWDWKEKGFKTVSDVKAYHEERKANKSGAKKNGSNKRSNGEDSRKYGF